MPANAESNEKIFVRNRYEAIPTFASNPKLHTKVNDAQLQSPRLPLWGISRYVKKLFRTKLLVMAPDPATVWLRAKLPVIMQKQETPNNRYQGLGRSTAMSQTNGNNGHQLVYKKHYKVPCGMAF
jgi:hypothetical protein